MGEPVGVGEVDDAPLITTEYRISFQDFNSRLEKDVFDIMEILEVFRPLVSTLKGYFHFVV